MSVPDGAESEASVKRSGLILHPLLLAVAPVLALAAHNKHEVLLMDTSSLVGVGLAMVVVAAIGWAAVRLVVRDWSRAALVTSLGVILFCSFGHVRGVLEAWLPGGWLVAGVWVGMTKCLVAVWCLLLVGGCLLLARSRLPLGGVTPALNMAAAVLLVMPAADLLRYRLGHEAVRSARTATSRATAATSEAPDIYYIILDAYARADVLQRIYGYDNRPFIKALQERGFYVAEESRSNYAFTYLSLASSLNMQHLTNLTHSVGEFSKDTSVPFTLIHENQVVQYLKAKGYAYVHFSSGCLWTQENEAADVSIRSGHANEFLLVFAQTTLLGALPLQKYLFREDARKRVLGALEGLGRLQSVPSPKFVFAHIVCPHPPFVFGPNGERVERAEVQMSGGVWREKGLYIDQMQFTNRKVLELVDRIQRGSTRPPVIVLQGDHGPWFGFASKGTEIDWSSHDVLWETMSILNAYHLPAHGQEMLYPAITPVNTFRLIFNACLGGAFPLLDDRSYYSDWQKSPYRFSDVTEKIR